MEVKYDTVEVIESKLRKARDELSQHLCGENVDLTTTAQHLDSAILILEAAKLRARDPECADLWSKTHIDLFGFDP